MTDEELLPLLELIAEAYSGPLPGFPPQLWIFPNRSLADRISALRLHTSGAQ